MILAISKNGIIGIDNKIPWYIKADLQRFRELTINHTQNIYLTLIDKDIKGDTFLNTEFLTNSDSEFSIKNISEQQICPISNLPYIFIYYERKN